MDSQNEIRSVFEALGMKFHDMGEFYAANEFSDLWYFLVPSDKGKWVLKVGIGEWDGDIVFVDRRISKERRLAMIAFGILFFVMMAPVFWFFIYSLYWVGALVATVLVLLIPRYSMIRARMQISPGLRKAGIETSIGGVVYLLPTDFEPRGHGNGGQSRRAIP